MKVSVGHLTYSVRRATVDDYAEFGNEVSGLCLKVRGEIILWPGQSTQEEASTLVHELLHALWHANDLPSEIEEEAACRRLEGPLMALMADNPQVCAAIIAARGGSRLPL